MRYLTSNTRLERHSDGFNFVESQLIHDSVGIIVRLMNIIKTAPRSTYWGLMESASPVAESFKTPEFAVTRSPLCLKIRRSRHLDHLSPTSL